MKRKSKISTLLFLLLILILSLSLGACSAETTTSKTSTESESSLEDPSSDESKGDESSQLPPTASSSNDENSSQEAASKSDSTSNPSDIPVRITYAIKTNKPTGGTITAPTSAYNGDLVNLSNTPETGYQFIEDSYTVKDANGTSIVVTGGTFVMPASEVEVTGSFTKINYQITKGSISNGTVTVQGYATYGDTVSLSASPATGYKLSTYTVKDANGKTISVSNNSFTMPASNVTVTATFIQIDYTITVTQPSNGTITVNKTTAHYGDTITLGNTPGTGYNFTSYTVNGKAQTTNTFTMPANNVTVSGTFTIKSHSVTITQPTGGTIKANNSTSTFNVNYGTKITLSNSASAGYLFSSYKVNNTSQTANTYTVTSNTTITGVFNKGIGGLSNLNFTANCNYGSSTSGTVTKNNNAVTSTQSGYPFVYAEALSDFYYETKVTFSQNDVLNNEGAPKIGIAINYKQEWMYSYIDAISSNGGWGGNTWLIATNGRGSLGSSIDWYWADIQERKFNFNVNYANETTFKLGVLRVGPVYNFFINDKLAYTLWLPEMDDAVNIGIMTFNMSYRCTDTKYGYSKTVLTNAKAYFGMTSNQNPTTVNMDGYAGDWKENATTTYGMTSGLKYFYATAFKGSDAVYAILKARTSNYITTNNNWWESTNVELRNEAKEQQFASANGQKSSGVIEAVFNAKWDGNLCTVTIELKLNADIFTNGIVGFAFRSEDGADNMQEGNYGMWWCGMHHPDWQRFVATTTGMNLNADKTDFPTESSIRCGIFADPFVLVANGKYYMYGTWSTSNFYVYSSTDMKTWIKGEDGTDESRLCFDPKTTANTFVKGNKLWAPEVVYNAKTKKYVMFYSGYLDKADNAYPKVGVATSDSPTGPFVDVHGGPLLYPNEEVASIDASCFIDDDGQAYLYFCIDCTRNYIENYHNGIGYSVSQTWVIKLDETYTKTVGDAVLCVTPDQDWEFNEEGTTCWNEGPYMYKYSGHYYLTYSANPFWNNLYGVGLAWSTSPMGPFTKYAQNPIVTGIPGVTAGTGHSMFFTDLNGNLWCAYHTYTKSDLNWKQGDDGRSYPYREAMLSRVWFKDYIPKVETGR